MFSTPFLHLVPCQEGTLDHVDIARWRDALSCIATLISRVELRQMHYEVTMSSTSDNVDHDETDDSSRPASKLRPIFDREQPPPCFARFCSQLRGEQH